MIYRDYNSTYNWQGPTFYKFKDKIQKELWKKSIVEKRLGFLVFSFFLCLKSTKHEAGTHVFYANNQLQPVSSFASHVACCRHVSGENTNHQLLLAVDTWVVGELYSGLPNWKDHFSANVSFTAPQVPWRSAQGG